MATSLGLGGSQMPALAPYGSRGLVLEGCEKQRCAAWILAAFLTKRLAALAHLPTRLALYKLQVLWHVECATPDGIHFCTQCAQPLCHQGLFSLFLAAIALARHSTGCEGVVLLAMLRTTVNTQTIRTGLRNSHTAAAFAQLWDDLQEQQTALHTDLYGIGCKCTSPPGAGPAPLLALTQLSPAVGAGNQRFPEGSELVEHCTFAHLQGRILDVCETNQSLKRSVQAGRYKQRHNDHKLCRRITRPKKSKCLPVLER